MKSYIDAVVYQNKAKTDGEAPICAVLAPCLSEQLVSSPTQFVELTEFQQHPLDNNGMPLGGDVHRIKEEAVDRLLGNDKTQVSIVVYTRLCLTRIVVGLSQRGPFVLMPLYHLSIQRLTLGDSHFLFHDETTLEETCDEFPQLKSFPWNWFIPGKDALINEQLVTIADQERSLRDIFGSARDVTILIHKEL